MPSAVETIVEEDMKYQIRGVRYVFIFEDVDGGW